MGRFMAVLKIAERMKIRRNYHKNSKKLIKSLEVSWKSSTFAPAFRVHYARMMR